MASFLLLRYKELHNKEGVNSIYNVIVVIFHVPNMYSLRGNLMPLMRLGKDGSWMWSFINANEIFKLL